MTPRSNYCSCPHCQTVQAVPTHLLGQTVPCAVCRTPFLVPRSAQSPVGSTPSPPFSPPVASPIAPPMTAPLAPPSALPAAPPIAPPISTPFAPPVAPPFAPSSAPPSASPISPPITAYSSPPIAHPPGAVGAYPLAPPLSPPLAAPFASPLAPPIAPPVPPPIAAPAVAASNADADPAATSEPLDEAEPRRRGRGLIWELAFLLTFLSLIVGGLAVAISVVQRRKQEKLVAEAEAAEEIRELQAEDELMETLHWSDASRFTLQKEAMKVRVREVVWGPVMTRDTSRRVMADDQTEFLCVYLSLRNSRDEVRYYRSWYGAKYNVSGAAKTAMLTDNADRDYPLHRFTAVTAIQGHVPAAELRRPEEIRDLIVFDLPERLDRTSVEWLHLELPAAAYGGEGFLRFEIPVAMIQNWGPHSGGSGSGLTQGFSEAMSRAAADEAAK